MLSRVASMNGVNISPPRPLRDINPSSLPTNAHGTLNSASQKQKREPNKVIHMYVPVQGKVYRRGRKSLNICKLQSPPTSY